MAYTVPAISDFKVRFARNFPFAPMGSENDPTYVMDTDIQNAIAMAGINFNNSLFDDQGSYNTAYLLLAAHYLVMNLRASSGGLAGGGSSWLVQSKSVGPISESYVIPQWIMDNPFLGMLAETSYGKQYLMFIAPLLVGQVFTACGGTTP